VASVRDHGSALFRILFLDEIRRVFRPQPSGVAVELMLPQRVARDEVDIMALRLKSQRDLSCGNPTTDDDDGFS
jgi:hypothetical protein